MKYFADGEWYASVNFNYGSLPSLADTNRIISWNKKPWSNVSCWCFDFWRVKLFVGFEVTQTSISCPTPLWKRKGKVLRTWNWILHGNRSRRPCFVVLFEIIKLMAITGFYCLHMFFSPSCTGVSSFSENEQYNYRKASEPQISLWGI